MQELLVHVKKQRLFQRHEKEKTHRYPLRCCNHLSEDLKIKIFWGACPTVLLGWSTFGEHLSEPSLNPGLSPNAQIVCGFLRLNLCNSWE